MFQTRVITPFLVLFAFALLLLVVHAQGGVRQAPDYFIDRLTIEQGLPNNRINIMLQDSKGYIWIGTNDGLCRYDGYHFSHYRSNPFDSTTLSGNYISSLVEDFAGNIWIGTFDGGLNRYNPQTAKFRRFPFSTDYSFSYTSKTYSANYIQRLFMSSDGLLWLGSGGGGLVLFNPKTEKFVEHYHYEAQGNNKISSNTIRAITEPRPGHIWIATRNGLTHINRHDRKTIVHRFSGNSADKTMILYRNNIWGLCPASDTSLWVGSIDGTLSKIDSRTGNNMPFSGEKKIQSALQKNSIMGLMTDQHHNLWITTNNVGLWCFDEGTSTVASWQYKPDGKFITSNTLTSIMRDRTGIIWVGTDRGISLFKPRRQTFLLSIPQPSPTAKNISSVVQDRQGTWWVGTIGFGLFLSPNGQALTPVRIRNKKIASMLMDAQISAIHLDTIGNIWVATRGAGLFMYSPIQQQWKSITSETGKITSISSNIIQSMYRDSKGNFWLGTLAGYDCFNPYTAICRRYNTNYPYTILSFCETKDGELLAGTFNGGLIAINPHDGVVRKIWKNNPGNPHSIPSNIIEAITEDNLGNLLIGSGFGLTVFDRKAEQFYQPKSTKNLSDRAVYQLFFYPDSTVWIISNKGLSRAIKDNNDTFIVTDFSERHGFFDDVVYPNAWYLDTARTLWVAGANGLYQILHDREPIQNSLPFPQVDFQFFKVFSKLKTREIVPEKNYEFHLSYTDQPFVIGFVGLEYSQPSKIQYAYKMDGVEKDWVVVSGVERQARYTNLEGGTYTFRVKVSNADGVWSPDEHILTIYIQPPFWKTRTFFFGSLVMIALGTGALYSSLVQNKVRKALHIEEIRRIEHEQIRKKAASDFHDEFGNKLTKIALLAEIMRQNPDSSIQENLPQLSKIITNATQISSGMRDFVWALNPDKDSLLETAVRLLDFGDDFFDKTGVDFQAEGIDKTFEHIYFPMDERRHIMLMFKESMNNVAKHANASTALLRFSYNGAWLLMELIDNGVGFIPSDTDSQAGQGMFTMKNRAEKAGGELTIFSEPGGGTTICFRKKIPQ